MYKEPLRQITMREGGIIDTGREAKTMREGGIIDTGGEAETMSDADILARGEEGLVYVEDDEQLRGRRDCDDINRAESTSTLRTLPPCTPTSRPTLPLSILP